MRCYGAVLAILICTLAIDAIPTITEGKQEFSQIVLLAKYQKCIHAKSAPDSSEDVICQDLDTIQSELDKINVLRTIKKFENFILKLKSYVNSTGFDASLFQHDQKSLHRKLSELTLVSKKYPGVEEVRDIREFATDLLSKLTESARFIKCYTYTRLKGHHLVLRLVKLKVKLITMQNLKGNSEKSLSSIKDLFQKDVSNLGTWKAEFDALVDPPLIIKIMFKDQLRKVERLVQVLMVCEESLEVFLKPEHFSSFFAGI